MKKTTLEELYQLADSQRGELFALAKTRGMDAPKLYLHWTAGGYYQKFEDYHINIDGDGGIWLTTTDLTEVLAHTWRRNTGAIGIALDCAAGATSARLGEFAPTAKQIETLAVVIAKLCDALWLTIDRIHVLTHGEAADNIDAYEYGYGADECYGPLNGCERWDLQYLGTSESPVFLKDYDDPRTGGNVLRGKANWYRNKWRAEKGE